MYSVRKIEVVFPDGSSGKYTYLLCDSFEEFEEDTRGVVSAPSFWDAQIGRLPRLEARTRAAQEETRPLEWRKNSHLSPNVRSVMKELGAVVSATVAGNLYGTGKEKRMREHRELVINRKVGKKYHMATVYIPGYESIFDGTINKKLAETVEIDPDYAYAYRDIGDAYFGNRDFDRAIENYSHAIKINPNYGAAYFKRGGMYYGKGDYDSAINDYTQVINFAPNSAVAYHIRGHMYYTKGDYDKSIEDLTYAIRLAPLSVITKEMLQKAEKARGDRR
jgi:tetratricopeptide (TPR) repeat protein